MSNIRRNSTTGLAVLLFVSSLSLGQQSPSLKSPQDEATIRNIVTRYFTFYANKDSDALMPLWDPAPPGLTARRKEIDKPCVSAGNTLLRDLAIRALLS